MLTLIYLTLLQLKGDKLPQRVLMKAKHFQNSDNIKHCEGKQQGPRDVRHSNH